VLIMLFIRFLVDMYATLAWQVCGRKGSSLTGGLHRFWEHSAGLRHAGSKKEVGRYAALRTGGAEVLDVLCRAVVSANHVRNEEFSHITCDRTEANWAREAPQSKMRQGKCRQRQSMCTKHA
jgi:hypothetical protein